MTLNIELLAAPSRGILEFFRQRVGPAAGKRGYGDAGLPVSAVALLQGKLIDLVWAMDVAEKAADVKGFDLKGSCPQNIGLFGLFGDLSDVEASIAAIEESQKQ